MADIGRVRRALAALDTLVERFPRLTGREARARLATWVDEEREEGDRGTDHHGSEEEDG